MKKRIVCFVLIAVLAIGFMPTLSFATSSGEFAGGSGTESDPYLISTKTHLNNVRNYLDAHFKMIADIEFTVADFAEGRAFYNDGQGFTPIGYDDNNPFKGTFDGNGYVIKNLYVNILSSDYVYAGLFGYVYDGTIKNLGMIDSTVSASSSSSSAYTGGIAGENDGSTITNCYNTGAVLANATSDDAYVGGIAGRNNKSTITNCYNMGAVSASSSSSSVYAGGVAGENYGTITNCYNMGDISATSSAGGIAGNNYSTITNCYNMGDISATSSVGGIAGYNWDAGTILNCYNMGDISDSSSSYSADAGGIAGHTFESTISNCYNMGTVSAETSSSYFSACAGGIAGLSSKSTITNCYNTGDVFADSSSSYAFAGGIAGRNHDRKCTISNCYNTGTVSATSSSSSSYDYAWAGGIAGENCDSTISNCYNTGTVSASSISSHARAGGIAGYNNDGSSTISNCYNTGTVYAETSSSYSSACAGGIAGRSSYKTISNSYYIDNISLGIGSGDDSTVKCTDTQLKEQATFAGFDFDSVWTFDATVQAYPILKGICYHHTFDNDCDITCNTCAFTRNGGHVWGDYVYNNDATTEKDGTKTRTCSACNEKETVTAEGTKLSAPIPTPDPDKQPVEIKDTSKIFTDVKADKWYTNAINYAYSHGFIAGVSNTEFGRDVPVTRGMFITILARIAGVNTNANKVDTKFADVKSGKYYTAAIKWASENGVVNGITDTTFEPNTAIERQQLCTMIVNFAKYMKINLTASQAEITFADTTSIRKYAKTAVATCQKAGIVSGYAVGSGMEFKPGNTATRAEAAQILYKFHKDFVA